MFWLRLLVRLARGVSQTLYVAAATIPATILFGCTDSLKVSGISAQRSFTAANDLLQKWPVSKRVNSSRTSDEDATLIDRIDLAVVD
jgi:hypothetical protein